jgi:uncharacterized RDD family membrane protein YckC
MTDEVQVLRYAGFGERVLASLIDSIVQLPIIVPCLWLLLRGDVVAAAGDPFLLAERIAVTLETPLGRAIVYGIPLFYCLVFWKFRSATPGKWLMDMKIVDARTGGAPSAGRWLLRGLGYVINVVILFIGFIWIAFDKRKQGLHDKLANTVVIKTPQRERPSQR